MIMSYKNSPQILQRTITHILRDFIENGVEVYANDIVIHAKNRSQHDERVIAVIKTLFNNNLESTQKNYR